MLKNYLKIALRNLRRHKGYAFINVAGLGVGLAGVLLMALYVGHELTFDRFHADVDRTFRLVQETGEGGLAQTGGAHAALLKTHVPAVEATVRLAPWQRTITVPGAESTEQTAFAESGFLYADPSFFEVFSFPLAQGDPTAALSASGTVVLTAATAQKYFGEADPMGRTLLMYDEYSEPNQIPLTVTGVLAEVPDRSHLRFSVLSSTATLEQQYGPLNQFNWPGLYTYVRLSGGADAQEAEQRATEALTERLADAEDVPALRLQPLTAIHLNPQERGERGVAGSKTTVYGLAGIALMVLLLACTNFTNLALARAATRFREVGIRRAVGAQRAQVAAQFLAEAFLLTGVALGVAVWLVWASLPLVSAMIGQNLASVVGPSVAVVLALLGVVGLTGLIAGAYPAATVARQSPTRALRGLAQVPRGAARTRAGLVVFQFGVSIALVAATLIVFQQLDYVRSLRLGFDQERIVTIPANGARRNFDPVREAFAAQPGVAAVSAANGLPGTQDVQMGMMAQREGQGEDGTPIHTQGVGPGFFELMDVRFVAGQLPAGGGARAQTSEPGASSERPIVLNETAATALGWSAEQAIGQRVRIVEPGNEANNPGLTGAVAGVVADFHHGSVRARIPASAYYPAQSADVPGLYVISHVLVKLAPGDAAASLARLEAAWQHVLPESPFEASFLDAQIQAQYVADQRLGRAVGLFAGLAILIASLGLFGLAAFAAERRRKEIGIRKVLGASVASVVALLSKDFAKLVGIAFVVAAPVAYLAMQRWLEDFAYRIDLGPWLFLAAGAAALAVALLTVSAQALRAATANPTEALRNE